MEVCTKERLAELQRTARVWLARIEALRKRKQFLEDLDLASENRTVWCADLTADLEVEATVGTIEIGAQIRAGDEGSGDVLIGPGGSGTGRRVPAMANSPAAAFSNWLLFPGWQKYRPTWRTGVIKALDKEANTATVMLDTLKSKAQKLDIQDRVQIQDVPVSYMSCNALVFEVGDQVVVSYTNQDPTKPRVSGFVKEPKTCCMYCANFGFDPDNPSYGEKGDQIEIRVTAGCGPYDWAVEEGTGGWAFSVGQTAAGERSNLLTVGCGTAVISVTDVACAKTITGGLGIDGVVMSSEGTWEYSSNTCELPATRRAWIYTNIQLGTYAMVAYQGVLQRQYFNTISRTAPAPNYDCDAHWEWAYYQIGGDYTEDPARYVEYFMEQLASDSRACEACIGPLHLDSELYSGGHEFPWEMCKCYDRHFIPDDVDVFQIQYNQGLFFEAFHWAPPPDGGGDCV